jgi:predicted transcriptional regulator
MTTEVTTCRPDDDVDGVMAVMTRGRFRHVPVVKDGRMIGVISIGDAVKARMEELEHERAALASYIASG